MLIYVDHHSSILAMDFRGSSNQFRVSVVVNIDVISLFLDIFHYMFRYDQP